jgi:SAM-dependent methyltransferase
MGVVSNKADEKQSRGQLEMIELTSESLYDHPRIYDLLFGSDWKAEFDFLLAAFDKFPGRRVRSVFEPACGTGRLLFKLAQKGYAVSGNDLNAKAVRFCNQRLIRHGFGPTAFVGDMSCFSLPAKVDAAFNLINSFRHLHSEAAALAHLRSMADNLAPGGLYVLGLHLTPAGACQCTRESWSARRGHLAATSRMWSIDVNRRARRERFGMAIDVYTPLNQFRLTEEVVFRTYTAGQFRRLLAHVPELELIETFDFAYDIERPVRLDGNTEDVVFVIRRRAGERCIRYTGKRTEHSAQRLLDHLP